MVVSARTASAAAPAQKSCGWKARERVCRSVMSWAPELTREPSDSTLTEHSVREFLNSRRAAVRYRTDPEQPFGNGGSEMAIDRRVARTRTALANALVALIRRKSYDRITVVDILAEANIGRATFYA